MKKYQVINRSSIQVIIFNDFWLKMIWFSLQDIKLLVFLSQLDIENNVGQKAWQELEFVFGKTLIIRVCIW